MKASDLIVELQKLIGEFGDLEVMIGADNQGTYRVQYCISFREEEDGAMRRFFSID